MRRFTLSLLFSVLAVLALALPVQAGWGWCMADPIVTLDGTQVQVLVAIPEEAAPLVNGPIDVEITTPRGTAREIVFLDAGFNGHGERVAFLDGGVRVAGSVGESGGTSFSTKIRVTLPLSQATTIPVEVTVILADAAPVVAVGTNEGVRVDLWLTGTK